MAVTAEMRASLVNILSGSRCPALVLVCWEATRAQLQHSTAGLSHTARLWHQQQGGQWLVFHKVLGISVKDKDKALPLGGQTPGRDLGWHCLAE